mgnify:CR=1 FL=1
MKKFIFSAIALAGFAAVSSAAEISEQEIVVSAVTDTPCADQYAVDMNALLNAGFSFHTADAIANLDFEQCLDDTYGPDGSESGTTLTPLPTPRDPRLDPRVRG